MSIFTYIKNDHKEIRTLLDQIENEGPEESELRTDLFNELKEKLLIHEHAEEEAFYKPLKQETSLLEDEIDESEEEHAETRDLLHQLTDPELVGEDWYDCFLELKEELIAHMDEEDEIFEDVRGLISTNDAQDMEADMKRQEKHERETKTVRKRQHQ
tara:strand:- start:6382 stop:6852 length:471 start_codon:yes stop_codon:yes gene_type:complete